MRHVPLQGHKLMMLHIVFLHNYEPLRCDDMSTALTIYACFRFLFFLKGSEVRALKTCVLLILGSHLTACECCLCDSWTELLIVLVVYKRLQRL